VYNQHVSRWTLTSRKKKGFTGDNPKKFSLSKAIPYKERQTETENEMKNSKERFYEYYQKAKAKNTLKSYKRGLELFLEYYGKDADTVLAERRADIQSENFEKVKHFDREVEAFYKWQITKTETREPYALTSARSNTLGVIQFFKYFGLSISPNIQTPPPTTHSFIPKIEELRRIFNISDLRMKTIISLGLDLSWRISDFMVLKVSDLPSLDQETPIPIEKITEKEKVLSSTFISKESVELLKAYLPTLNAKNEYLFQTNHQGHLDNDSINYELHRVTEKAKVIIPKNKRFTFHSLRKRFLSTAYSIGIDHEISKLLVGKSIGQATETYLGDVKLKEAFIKVREEALSLSNGTIKSEIESKDKRIEELKNEVKELRTMMKTMSEIYGKEILEKAKAELHISGEKGETKLSPYEALKLMAKIREKEEEDAYRKMLENGNGNGA
jgi:integrase